MANCNAIEVGSEVYPIEDETARSGVSTAQATAESAQNTANAAQESADTASSVAETAQSLATDNASAIGTLSNLETSAKDSLVNAINELAERKKVVRKTLWEASSYSGSDPTSGAIANISADTASGEKFTEYDEIELWVRFKNESAWRKISLNLSQVGSSCTPTFNQSEYYSSIGVNIYVHQYTLYYNETGISIALAQHIEYSIVGLSSTSAYVNSSQSWNCKLCKVVGIKYV